MTTADRLAAAWDDAQRAFHAMLIAKAYPNPDAPETRAYVAAERVVDELLVEAQWEKAKTELDRLQAIDEALMAELDSMVADGILEVADDDGDHFVYPAGVGR